MYRPRTVYVRQRPALTYEQSTGTLSSIHNYIAPMDTVLDVDANLSWMKLNMNPSSTVTAYRVIVYIPKSASSQLPTMNYHDTVDPQQFTVLSDTLTRKTGGGDIDFYSKTISLKNRYFESSGAVLRNNIKVYVLTDSTINWGACVAYRIRN